MMQIKRANRALFYMLAVVLTVTLARPGLAAAAPVSQRMDRGIVTVGNDQIEITANELGQFTIGARGGDPQTPQDDGKRLMYGHGNRRFTSYTTARVASGGQTEDQPLLRLADPQPVEENGALRMGWQLPGLALTQTLAPANNPYTNRPDTVRISVTATNTSSAPLSAGVRIMLDTMIGENDKAPFFAPGAGNFDTEREFAREQMPAYWKAFEASDYDPASLKGQGILTGGDATPPDRLVFATWPMLKDTAWDYPLDAGRPVGDSAVALYWEPQELAPGGSVTWVTYYGLAGVGGGNAWIDAPVSITSDAPEFDATLWVANLSEADFAGGEATINLPEGLTLADGEIARKPMATVPINGGAQSVSWRLVGEGSVDATYPYSATVTFASGSGPLTADASVDYRVIAAAAPLPTDTAVPPVVAPIAPAPQEDRDGFPWWVLLPLLLLPLLLLLLLRRRSARPAMRAAPPRVHRAAPPLDFTERQEEAGPQGANVTHGRKKPDGRDPRENPLG